MKLFLISFIISVAAAAPKIIGGIETPITEVPYQLELDLYTSSWTFACGAVVIGHITALTSARCVDGQGSLFVQIRGGSNKREKGDTYTPQYFIIHPNFTVRSDGVPENDIAVIALNAVTGPFQISDRLKPIELAEALPNDDEEALISGWGYTSEGGSYSNNLLKSNISIINKQHCVNDLGLNITPDMICGGNEEGTHDTCTGDQGGPLTINGKLGGITSWGLGCGQPHRPRVYANIAHFKDWIEEQQEIIGENKNSKTGL